jgi:hypothetical protein
MTKKIKSKKQKSPWSRLRRTIIQKQQRRIYDLMRFAIINRDAYAQLRKGCHHYHDEMISADRILSAVRPSLALLRIIMDKREDAVAKRFSVTIKKVLLVVDERIEKNASRRKVSES